MNEKDTGHEHTGLGMELKLLLREPPLLISIYTGIWTYPLFFLYCHGHGHRVRLPFCLRH